MASLIGQSLGRYQILEQLGEGGMAVVYKAYDTQLERHVAIKLIRQEAFSPLLLEQVLQRFEREARALAKLSHPNIVHVHDYGKHEGAPYLVMEYLPGGSLNIRSGALMPWQEAVRILLPIAQALAYAHGHNIVHRDIKPSNILLTENGLPKLSDFGIAKILESEGTTGLTGTGMGIGTPEYMAPEQWTGQAGTQADIYSLGVVLYELVTGHKPYIADTPAAILLKQASDPLPSPRQFVADLPDGLEEALLKALEKKPEERYQSMSEFAVALENLTSGQTIPAGASLEGGQTEKTRLAGGVWGQAAGQRPEGTIPPDEHRRRPLNWGLRTAMGGLVVLILAGATVGFALLNMGQKGRGSLAGPASTNTATSSLVTTPTLAQASPTLTNPTQTVKLTAPAEEVKVLWDISHGPKTGADGSLYTPDGMYKSLAQTLGNEGFTISSGDLTDLNSYSILVLSEASVYEMAYTNSEADKIEQFVRVGGHALLILDDIPEYKNLLDMVGGRFSIGLGEIISDGPVSYSKMPFFSGVTAINFLSGGGGLQVASPSQAAALDQNGNPVIATCECDAGRVMVISDTNLWDNDGFHQADNQRFASNAFQWLAKLSP